MNSIRQIQELNKRELENGVSTEASWHADYRDTAYIFIGGLPFELSEGDVITIFSQFGEPTYINLVRDKETGKSKGFAFLKYEDQRSTDLAVDNLGGSVVMGRTLKVDHTRYKKKDDEPDEGISLSGPEEIEDGDSRRKRRRTSESLSEEEQRPLIKEEKELAALIHNHDEDDPMKAFLIEEKKEEVALALARVKNGKRSEKEHKHRHRHHKSRRPREQQEEGTRRSQRHEDEHAQRRRSHSKEDPARRNSKDKPRQSRLSEEDRSRLKEYNSRQRSPREYSEDRARTSDIQKSHVDWRSRRDDSREDRYRRSKRYP